MADENKDDQKIDATEDQVTDDQTASEGTDEGTDDKSSSTEDKIDYEAILKAERERADKAEKALAARAFKTREAKREDPEEEQQEDDDNKPITRRELLSVIHETRQTTQKELSESRALDIARANTSSENEAQAALVYWKNRVVPTGDLNEDMRFAIAGLNHRKTVAKAGELARAVRSKDTASHDAAGTHRDPAQGTAPKMPAGATQAYKDAGFSFDGTKRLWVKKLPSGKTLFKDPKSKKQWVA